MIRQSEDLIIDPRIECGTEQMLLDVALPSSHEHLSRGSSTCLFAPSKSILKTRRKRLSSTTRGIIPDFGEEPECSRRGPKRACSRSTFDYPHYRSLSVLLVHSIPVRRNERGCERHPARRFFRKRDAICHDPPVTKAHKFKVCPRNISTRKSVLYFYKSSLMNDISI